MTVFQVVPKIETEIKQITKTEGDVLNPLLIDEGNWGVIISSSREVSHEKCRKIMDILGYNKWEHYIITRKYTNTTVLLALPRG